MTNVCSPEEAGRYLETYKVYENKPPDALLGQSEGDYLSKVITCNVKSLVVGLHTQPHVGLDLTGLVKPAAGNVTELRVKSSMCLAYEPFGHLPNSSNFLDL